MIVLEESNVAAYLLQRGLIQRSEEARACVLSGGVSNQVLKIVTPSQSLVIKQARPRLRVELEWLADIERIFAEYACLELLQRILPPGSVPQPLFLDRENYLYAMESAPDGSLNWKAELLAGRIDPALADQAGRLLALIHQQTAGDRSALEAFADQRVFFQLRVDPYYRTMV
ncbi:MAG TPA: phosphotransferase, partial [Limnochorda sp.]